MPINRRKWASFAGTSAIAFAVIFWTAPRVLLIRAWPAVDYEFLPPSGAQADFQYDLGPLRLNLPSVATPDQSALRPTLRQGKVRIELFNTVPQQSGLSFEEHVELLGAGPPVLSHVLFTGRNELHRLEAAAMLRASPLLQLHMIISRPLHSIAFEGLNQAGGSVYVWDDEKAVVYIVNVYTRGEVDVRELLYQVVRGLRKPDER